MKLIKTVSITPESVVRFMQEDGKVFKFVYRACKATGMDVEVSAFVLSDMGWHEIVSQGDFECPDHDYVPENLADEDRFSAQTKERAEILFSLMEEHIKILAQNRVRCL